MAMNDPQRYGPTWQLALEGKSVAFVTSYVKHAEHVFGDYLRIASATLDRASRLTGRRHLVTPGGGSIRIISTHNNASAARGRRFDAVVFDPDDVFSDEVRRMVAPCVQSIGDVAADRFRERIRRLRGG